MMTTISIVNIHHLIDAKKKEKIIFFLVMRTFGVYSLSNFPIYHTAVLAIVIMPTPSPGLTGLIGRLYFHPIPTDV